MGKSFAVIGLGSFGRSVANELIELGADLLVIDTNEGRINSISKKVQNAVICDSTDEEALLQIGIKAIDNIIVCIGDDQASIMTTLILREINPNNRIFVKVNDDYHAKVVDKIGATEVIYPEKDMGTRFANRIIKDSIMEYIPLKGNFAFVEQETPESWVGKTIFQLNVRKNFNVNVVSVRRNGGVITATDKEPFQKDDVLLIVGNNKDLAKIK